MNIWKQIKNPIIILVMVLLMSPGTLADDAVLDVGDTGTVHLLNRTLWKFTPHDDISYGSEGVDTPGWYSITIIDGWRFHPEFSDYRGLGWYRLAVRMQETGDYALFLTRSSRGVQVYVNGVLAGETRPFTKDGRTPPMLTKPQVMKLPAHLWRKGDNLLAVRAGELDGFNSLADGIALGPYEKVRDAAVMLLGWYGAVAFLLVFLSINYLFYFLTRLKERYYLYFSGFCLAQGLWSLGYQGIILYIADSQMLYTMTAYVCGAVAPALLIAFLHEFYNRRRDIAGIAIIVLFAAIAAAAVLNYCMAGNMRFFNVYLYDALMLLILINVVYVITVAVLETVKKKPYAMQMLLGVVIQGSSLLVTMLYLLRVIWRGNIVMEGSMAMAVIFSWVLASRFASINEGLEQANRELVMLDKMKDDFLATTSHELRTPLHGITGIAEALLDGGSPSLTPQARESIGIIHESARRLNSLINEILDFSKLQAGKVDLFLEEVDMRSLLSGIVSLARGLVGDRKIDLRCEVPGDLPAIVADRYRIEQVVLNLVGNAVKFTEQGEVVVSAWTDQGTGGILVSVRDTGCGIEPGFLEGIWRPYAQADAPDTRSHGGTGLGLPISKRLVELHGGQISVESARGHGSVFRFNLPHFPPGGGIQKRRDGERPAVREVGGMGELMSPAREQRDTAGASVLAVDDDPVSLKILIDILERGNYRVRGCVNAGEALAAFEEEVPDLVLLDIMLPGMSGYELAMKIRTAYGSSFIPIIMLTARNQMEDMLKGFDSGANDYLTKPFNARELVGRVENLLVMKYMMDIEKRMRTGLQRERADMARSMAERGRAMSDAVARLAEWENIITNDLRLAKLFIGRLMEKKVLTPALEFAVRYEPLHAIGGDIYDIYEYAPGRVRVFIADATGHGINASLNSISIMTEYNLLKREELPPGGLLSQLNGRFTQEDEGYRAVFTCFAAEIDMRAEKVVCAGAGHLAQYVISERDEITPVRPRGPIIGFRGGVSFEEVEIPFTAGTRMVLLTDGVFSGMRLEPSGRGSDSWEEALMAAVAANIDEHEMQSFVAGVHEAVKSKRPAGAGTRGDDETIIALMRTG